MTNEDIIKLYKKGHSIDYITNLFYTSVNSRITNNYWENGRYIINAKEMNKNDAHLFVVETIYNYIQKKEV